MAAPTYGYPASGPSISDPTAVMGRRIGAFFLDALVALIVFGAVFAGGSERLTLQEAKTKYGCTEQLRDRTNSNNDTVGVSCPNRLAVYANDEVYIVSGGSFFGLTAAFTFLYFALLPGLTGWTLGKLLVGIRVVDGQGKRAGVGRNALRWLLFVVDSFFFFLPGLITALASKGHRRIGDMAAGTFVVDHRALGTPPLALPQYAPQPYSPQAYGAPPPPAAPAPPVWDAARNTYVQHDPSTGGYLQWDAATGTWKALDT